MATITLTCPHCLSERMTCDVVGFRPYSWWKRGGTPAQGIVARFIAAFCRKCSSPIGVTAKLARATPYSSPDTVFSHNIDVTEYFEFVEVFPSYPEIKLPEHLPDAVAAAFREAEESRGRNIISGAGMLYRRALDLATKALDPEVRGTLEKRLIRLKNAGKLTASIADWSDHVRLLGNEAAHDETPPTLEEVDDLANLTRMTLVYLFEMPERVRLMREHKEGAGATPVAN